MHKVLNHVPLGGVGSLGFPVRQLDFTVVSIDTILS